MNILQDQIQFKPSLNLQHQNYKKRYGIEELQNEPNRNPRIP